MTRVPAETSRNLAGMIQRVKGAYYPLIWVVTAAPEDATLLLTRVASHHHAPLLSLGQHLAERLIPVTSSQRHRQAISALDQLAQPQSGVPVFLDRIEVLFEPALAFRVGRQMEEFSRTCTTLIVAWPGRITSTEMFYGISGHPEFQSHPFGSCPVLSLDADLQILTAT